MEIAFNLDLAHALKEYNDTIRANPEKASAFKSNPTESVKSFLNEKGVTIPTPDMFHAHLIGKGNPLPDEPERATVDRYIYIFKNDGIFEFKTVPGTPDGNDDIMLHPTGACCCCNCCAIEL